MLDVSIDDRKTREMLLRLGDPDLVRLVSLALRTELHSRLAPYPPSTDANRPVPGTTHYQRGLGSIYTRKSGGKTVRRTSEMAGRKWQMSVRGTIAVLSNTASYSGYLWDDRYQPSFHAQRGWKTVQKVWEEMDTDGTVDRILTANINAAVRRRG